MKFACSVTEKKDPVVAASEAAQEVLRQLSGSSAQIAFLFISGLYKTDWGTLLARMRNDLGNPLLLGCTGGGVVGMDKEFEFTPALSLVAAALPRVTLHPFHVTPDELQEPHGPGFWIEKLGSLPAQDPIGILLPEPFSCDCNTLIAALNASYPKMPVIGGLASGAQQPGENSLFFNEQVFKEGAVGVTLTGDIQLQTIVSQGCRPIGRPYIVTKAEENVILELAGLPPAQVMQELFAGLTPADRALAQRALLLGIVMDEKRQEFRRGDFLIRNLIGLDPETGAMAIGDRIQVGQTVQFQLRDAGTSREDLEALLKERADGAKRGGCAGGLVFCCLGRGSDLYGEPNVDIRTIQSALGNLPIAGFFCNGEIGPIAGRNFIHGFTSSLGLFRPRS